MKRTVFALFGGPGRVEGAVRALLDDGRCEPKDVGVVVHDPDEGGGAAAGGDRDAVLVALGTAVRGPFGLHGAGAAVAPLLYGAMTGAIPAALDGGLAGLGFAEHSLHALATRLQPGGALVTVRVADPAAERSIVTLLAGLGARVAIASLPESRPPIDPADK